MRRIACIRLLLLALVWLAAAHAAPAQFSITVGFAPPELPVYEQPLCPGDDYIWTPGYWAWDPDADDYYWVPGTWVLAPEPGLFWTPPYWGWVDGRYAFYAGYWGPQVGFYGGINYGFGYFGHGFDGGRWEHGHFFYNRYVSNVNVTVVHNVYETRVENRREDVARVSFNGGHGGIDARASTQEQAYARERHVGETSAQNQHIQAARGNTEFRASANHGRPPVAATGRPGEFRGGNVAAARSGGNYNPPANRGAERGGSPPTATNAHTPTANHMRDVPAYQRPAAPNTGNAQRDQKYQQQQNKLYEKQNQQRQQLEQKQEQEHQRAQQRNYNQGQQQQMEQHHQQQTQQMTQRHQQQQQQMQQRQAPPQQHQAPPQQHGGGNEHR